ncbi:hypothetical protein PENSPDRAFT_672559 [Peniophora sp. CONT]|nr:hypothetical protein PENSPDRAFT_672559 [Peniophora sp. CONT]
MHDNSEARTAPNKMLDIVVTPEAWARAGRVIARACRNSGWRGYTPRTYSLLRSCHLLNLREVDIFITHSLGAFEVFDTPNIELLALHSDPPHAENAPMTMQDVHNIIHLYPRLSSLTLDRMVNTSTAVLSPVNLLLHERRRLKKLVVGCFDERLVTSIQPLVDLPPEAIVIIDLMDTIHSCCLT